MRGEVGSLLPSELVCSPPDRRDSWIDGNELVGGRLARGCAVPRTEDTHEGGRRLWKLQAQLSIVSRLNYRR